MEVYGQVEQQFTTSFIINALLSPSLIWRCRKPAEMLRDTAEDIKYSSPPVT